MSKNSISGGDRANLPGRGRCHLIPEGTECYLEGLYRGPLREYASFFNNSADPRICDHHCIIAQMERQNPNPILKRYRRYFE